MDMFGFSVLFLFQYSMFPCIRFIEITIIQVGGARFFQALCWVGVAHYYLARKSVGFFRSKPVGLCKPFFLGGVFCSNWMANWSGFSSVYAIHVLRFVLSEPCSIPLLVLWTSSTALVFHSYFSWSCSSVFDVLVRLSIVSTTSCILLIGFIPRKRRHLSSTQSFGTTARSNRLQLRHSPDSLFFVLALVPTALVCSGI